MNIFQVYETINSRDDSSRVFANLSHLIELIQYQEKTGEMTITTLLNWFGGKISGDEKEEDGDSLRIDSDHDGVRVMTLFKSKGLEFNFVFYPYVNGGKLNKTKRIPCYFSEENVKQIDFSALLDNSETITNQLNLEYFAENLRIFYVGVTRGIYMNYLFFNKKELETDYHPISYYIKRIWNDNCIPDCSFFSLKRLDLVPSSVIKSEISPTFSEKKDQIETKNLVFKREWDTPWKIQSFSSLTKEYHEYMFEDTTLIEEIENIFLLFPGGTETGLIFHDVFEKIDYQAVEHEQIIRELIEQYNIYWNLPIPELQVIQECVNFVLDASLVNPDSSLSLRECSFRQRMNETEFYFSVSQISLEIIKQFFPDLAESLRFESFKGFLHGFIDLIFEYQGKYYIIDWKTNDLGKTVESYTGEGLNRAMTRHHYDLQALIYTIALNLFLKNRIKNYQYSHHFGGVYYLFVRGMAAFPKHPDAGVWFYQFPAEKIEKISQMIGKNDGLAE